MYGGSSLMNLNLKIILSLIMISAILGTSGYLILSQLDKLSEPILIQIPNSIADLAKKSIMDDYAQLIQYYDEVLTQSARNYAFTQDKKWEERYREAEPKLIEVLDKAIDAGGDLEKEFVSQIDEANMVLVAMEYAAIDLVNAGKTSEAIDILESQEYWDYKNFYLDGLNDYVSDTGMQHHDAIEVSTTTLDELSKTTQVLMTDSRNTFLFSIPVILVTLFTIAYLIHKTIINPIKKLKDATISIGAGNWDTNVVIKGNDEIHDLSKSFNNMTDSLKKSTIHVEQLEKINSALERMSVIGELTSRLVHDLKNPLGVINMITKMQKMELPQDDEKGLKRIEKIDESYNSIMAQIRDVLDYIKEGKFTFRETSLSGIISKAIKMTEIPDEVKLNQELKEIKISADGLKLQVVFSNLLRNAVEAMEGKGQINIRVEDMEDKIKIEFEDSGPGIPTGEIKKIFEPLFTTKQTGTGLGLSSCTNIVQQHNGTISVHNNPTTLTITLPKIIPTQQEGRVNANQVDSRYEGTPQIGWYSYITPKSSFCMEKQAKRQGKHFNGYRKNAGVQQ